MANIYTLKDGKMMHNDKIACTSGDFVWIKDYKALESKAEELKCELDKTYNQLMEVEKDAQEIIAELKHELEEKCRFETDRLVKLPFDALGTVNMLTNATYRRKANGIDRLRWCEEDTIETDMYSIDDLEQIAEHLLVYCKHNREDDE